LLLQSKLILILGIDAEEMVLLMQICRVIGSDNFQGFRTEAVPVQPSFLANPGAFNQALAKYRTNFHNIIWIGYKAYGITYPEIVHSVYIVNG
jgi:hypothetical protein